MIPDAYPIGSLFHFPTVYVFGSNYDLSLGYISYKIGVEGSEESTLETGTSFGVGMKLKKFKRTEDIVTYVGFRLSQSIMTSGATLLRETTISPRLGIDVRLKDYFSIGYELRLNLSRQKWKVSKQFIELGHLSNHLYFRFGI